jgi:hypothetical protein
LVGVDIASAGNEDRLDESDELVAGRGAVHPHPGVLPLGEDDNRRRHGDAVLAPIVGIENEVLLDHFDLVVEAGDFVEDLFGDEAAFAPPDGLREEQDRDRFLEG